jgi:hypothetical protein
MGILPMASCVTGFQPVLVLVLDGLRDKLAAKESVPGTARCASH